MQYELTKRSGKCQLTVVRRSGDTEFDVNQDFLITIMDKPGVKWVHIPKSLSRLLCISWHPHTPKLCPNWHNGIRQSALGWHKKERKEGDPRVSLGRVDPRG